MLETLIASMCSEDTEPMHPTESVWLSGQQIITNAAPQLKGCSQFHLRVLEHRNQFGPGLCECWPRPLLITAAKLVSPVLSELVKQWNFRKVDWNNYNLFTNKAMQSLKSFSTTNVEETYQDFCSAIIKVAKRSIPRSCRNNYITCGISNVRVFIRPSWILPMG